MLGILIPLCEVRLRGLHQALATSQSLVASASVRTIDRLPDDVRVTGMSSRLLDHVEGNPAQIVMGLVWRRTPRLEV